MCVELETTAQEVLGKLRSHTLFQSKWDTAALIIFLIFLGTVLLFLLLVCIHCCCYSCCSRRVSRPQKVSSKQVSPTGPPRLGGRQGRPGTALGRGGCRGSRGEGLVGHTPACLSCRYTPGEWITWPWSLNTASPQPPCLWVLLGSSDNASFAQSRSLQCVLSFPARGGQCGHSLLYPDAHLLPHSSRPAGLFPDPK
uniref:Small integral membrane protein 22 n=1 Tax=Canis lupus dingo TaxID=286419 RepID=A0A8C0LLQ5_CANLU